MSVRLTIVPHPGSGWEVAAPERPLPASFYDSRGEAERDAADYIAGHGGQGELLVCDWDGRLETVKRWGL
jgi:hypothetical protein